MKKPIFGRTDGGSPPGPPSPDPAQEQKPPGASSAYLAEPAAGGRPERVPARWLPSPRARNLATAALLALVAAIATGHAALVLLAAPALAALALMPRRPRAGDLELTVDVTQSGSRCFEGEDVTITATVRAPGSRPLDEVTIRLDAAPQVALADPARPTQAFLRAAGPCARWVVRPQRWGRYSPGTVRVTGRSASGGYQVSIPVSLDPMEVFPRPTRMRARLVPAELLRRIGEHAGRAVGEGVEFAGIRPYVPGDQLRDVNRAVSIRRGQLHVNQRAAARAADLVVMIDTFGDSGPVSERAMDVAVHGAAALVTAYLKVADRAGLVVLGGMLRWLGPASGDRQFYRIAEMMLAARYDSFVTPDVGRIPRTALPPGTLVVVFSPLLDPRGFGAVTDLRQRGFPLIAVDTLRDEPPVQDGSPDARLALRLWRLDRAAARSALLNLGVPVLNWPAGTELDSVLAPLRKPPPGQGRATRPLASLR
ncbi:MAG TPA: DUF58 domain-containing protein [Streptosporangiaceae bacterium]|nr:DUF58 domain-containing protein [Streptosporangiaceae bacterium]